MTGFLSPFTGDVIQPTDVSYRAFSIAANTTLSWPIDGNTNGDYAARIMSVTATAGSLSLAMPPANQVSVGQDALVLNPGSNTFTLTDYAGNTIVSVPAGAAKYVFVATNATTAGTWNIISFGATSAGPDASALAGAGLAANGSVLQQTHPSAAIVTGATLLTTTRAKTLIWSGGAGTTTLPTAASAGDNWFTLIKNNGTGTLTVNTQGSDTLDGESSATFQPNDAAFVVCDGAQFVTVGYGRSINYAFTVLTKTVSTGSYSLTPNEASNFIHEYNGSLAGNVTVTYPPVVNMYVVANQVTPNGYTLTLTTGIAGGTTATIPAGQQATLICDGANFLNANTYQAGATAVSLSSGTAGAPSLNFAAETSTGVYRPGVGQFGVSILGTLRLAVAAAGITVTGTGTFSGGVSGGTFP